MVWVWHRVAFSYGFRDIASPVERLWPRLFSLQSRPTRNAGFGLWGDSLEGYGAIRGDA